MAKKYIDADTVSAKIKELKSEAVNNLFIFAEEGGTNKAKWQQQKNVCEKLLSFIDSLTTDIVHIPTCWVDENIKKTPSECSYASFDSETGEYSSGTSYFDAEGNEITKEEYEALVGRPTD
jgi:hypothetical protein